MQLILDLLHLHPVRAQMHDSAYVVVSKDFEVVSEMMFQIDSTNSLKSCRMGRKSVPI